MAVFASPKVHTNEIDLTTIVPSSASTEGAIAGVFHWGPVEQRSLIDSEDILKERYGSPSNFNAETWFTAASFLGYGNRLYVSRAADVTGNNILAEHIGNSTNLAIQGNQNILKLSNTSGLTAGMKLFWSNNSNLPLGEFINSVNSTAVILTADAIANVESVEVIFRENITYSAVAIEDHLGYDETNVDDWDEQTIKNENHFNARVANGESWDSSVLYVARFPGEYGNSLRVAVCDRDTQYFRNLNFAPDANAEINSTASGLYSYVGNSTLVMTVTPADVTNSTHVTSANDHIDVLKGFLNEGDLLEVGSSRLGHQYMKILTIGNIENTSNVFTINLTMDEKYKLASNTRQTRVKKYWEFYNTVDVAPGQSNYVLLNGNTSAKDELHVIIVDEDGKFSGSPGTVLEIYRNLSRATDAKGEDGASLYYKDVINQRSNYVWVVNDRTTARSNTANYVRTSTGTHSMSMNMVGGDSGKNEANIDIGTLAFAYDQFGSTEDIDVSLIMQGKARGEAISHYTQLGNYLIDNITEKRKDCVAFISPHYSDVVYNYGEEVDSTIEFRSVLRSSSYAVLDSGYKYMYDKYNDVYRWIPLNGDTAGLCARTDQTNAPWWSPAGYNRGHIKNIIRLAWNPREAQRDSLYREGINPIINDDGQGTVLFGDKTLLAKPSSFDRINVRRLFIVLRKSISKAAKYSLFEFNDPFTRSQFKSLIVPYLRDVQGKRGITDFLVVCDETNNTGEVIDRNEFVADIYIKPARSINYIQLNFIAVRTAVSFSEVVGRTGI